MLRGVVKKLRKEIERLGGQVLFNTKLENISLKNGQVKHIVTSNGQYESDVLVLGIGHSARDSYRMLNDIGVAMEAKPFSVGFRIEHLQKEIDNALYGSLAGHPLLPSAEYQLSYRENDRGVYTFCMCPGGSVVAAASISGGVVTNGMSNHARDGENANSAVVVSVSQNDFGNGLFDGMDFQQKLEKSAFTAGAGGYVAPAQSVDRFLSGEVGFKLGRVQPSYPLGVTGADFATLFPSAVTDMLKQGISRFGKKIRGFDAADSMLTGIETRTSAPIRILRNENFESISTPGLYPAGEGAGYAGGIMSAAVDGIKVARAILSRYAP